MLGIPTPGFAIDNFRAFPGSQTVHQPGFRSLNIIERPSRNFRSKEGLIHEVLQTYLAEIKTGASHVNYEINSWRDLEKWFLAHLELQKHYEMTRGCPFGTLGSEVTQNDELIRQDVSLIFEVVKHKLAAFFVREKAKGRLTKKASEEHMADFCIATIQGAMLMGKIKRSSQTVETTVQGAVAHLKSYLAKPKH
jgi:TetR/AcrR family transcriptional repressor of nem operon